MRIGCIALLGLIFALAACGGRSEQHGAQPNEAGSGGRAAERVPLCGHTGGRAEEDFEFVFGADGSRLGRITEAEDGSLLALVGLDLLRIERDGEVVKLESVVDFQSARVLGVVDFAPYARAIAVQESSRLSLFDGEGRTLLASIDPPDGQTLLNWSFSGSGELLVAVYGQVVPERELPEVVIVRRVDGGVLSTLPARKAAPVIPASDDRMLWLPGWNETELIVTTLENTELARMDLGTRTSAWRMSEGGTVLMLQLESGSVWHIEPGYRTEHPPGLGPPTLGLAPGGRFSVLGHPAPAGSLELFDAGTLIRKLDSQFHLIRNLDVNDSGDVLLAASDPDRNAQVMFFDSNLDTQFSCWSGTTGSSFAWLRDGRRALATFGDRLMVFALR